MTPEQISKAVYLRSQIEAQLDGEGDLDLDQVTTLLKETEDLLYDLLLDEAFLLLDEALKVKP